jgi:hypothetical protein
LLQVNGSIVIAKVLQLQSAEFLLTNTSMAGSFSGHLADVPMAVNLTLDSAPQVAGKSGNSSLAFDASTKGPLSMSKLLDKLWSERPEQLSSFVGGLTFPAMAVSYRSNTSTYRIEAVSGLPAQPFLALGDAINITEPAATYVNSPRALSMAFTVDIPAMGVTGTRATLQSTPQNLSLQVGRQLPAGCLHQSCQFAWRPAGTAWLSRAASSCCR